MRPKPAEQKEKWRLLVLARWQLGDVLEETLELKGFEVTVLKSDDVVDVRAELSGNQYDLVLPTNNGLSFKNIPDLVSWVKKDYPCIKVIVLSGFTESEFISDLKQRGADDFLPLPFKIDDLTQRIRNMLSMTITGGENET